MKTITRAFLSIIILFLFSASTHAQYAQDAIKFWIKVYGAPPAVANMTFGNRVGNTTSGQDTGASFPVEYREQETPPPSPGFDAVWGSVRGGSQFGTGVRGLLDRQFNGWSGVPTQKDTFRIIFAQADNADQDISFKWIDAINIALRCDSLVMVYLDPSVGSIVRLNMSTTDSLVIPAAGTKSISSVRIFKYGSHLTDESVHEQGKSPTSFALHQNYPNPFNPETRIKYEVSSREYVRLHIYDTLGREIATLVDEIQDAGFKSVTWDAAGMPSGVYFYRLHAGSFEEVKKMLMIR